MLQILRKIRGIGNKALSVSTLLMIIILLTTSNIQAQPIPEPIDIPIDGGVFYLLAAGIAYGVKKMYHARKENK